MTNASDNARTGWYPDQPGLTPSEITGNNFGQLFSATLNGGIGSQPLLADGTLLVTTQSNWAYGLDPTSGVIKWSRQVGVPWQPSDISCTDVTSGIRSTPVIDAAAGIAYFTSKTYVSGTTGPATWRLFAVSMTTGADEPGFPVTIQGTAQNNPGMTFGATDQLQRPGLLLLNGVVYMGFGSNCDRGTYQGWVFGVSTAGVIKARWVDCGLPDGSLCAGIWQSGGGLTSDGDGNIIFITGNNASPTPPVSGTPPPANLGESVVRLVVQGDGTLKATDFFAPYDAVQLDTYDADFGSGAPMLLPSQYFGTPAVPNLMVASGKQGYMYLLNRDNLGGSGEGPGGSDNVVQRLGPNGGVWSRPSAWPGDGGWIWVNTGGSTSPGAFGYLQAYKYGTTGAGIPALSLYAQSTEGFGYGDGSPMITSDGTAPGSGVVWMIWSADNTGNNAQLRAYSATPTGSAPTLLWSAPIGATAAKFAPVGIGDGTVYVGTKDGHLVAYGEPVNQPLQAPAVQFPPSIVGSPATATETLTANAALTITALTPQGAGFAVTGTTPSLPATLAAGQTLSVAMSFTPQQIGPASGSMGIATSAGNTAIALSGQGVSPNPVMQESTPVVSFGGTTPGNPVTQSVILTNVGGATLTFATSTLPSAPFTVVGIPASGQTLAPNASVTITTTFAPTAPGTFSDEAIIDSDGGNVTLGLTGQAHQPSILVISPLTQAFPDTPVGSTSTLTFTITAVGQASLEITKSQPPASGVISPLSQLPEASVIGGGQSQTIAVQFSPTAAGTFSDTWIITTDDGQGAQTVHFVGYASAPGAIGSLDPSYGTGGTTVTRIGAGNNATAAAVMFDAAGNTLVSGTALDGQNSANQPVHHSAVVRLTPGGSLDPTFGGGTGEFLADFGGGGLSNVAGLGQGTSGTVLLWGSAEASSGVIKLFVARLASAGALDRSWGSNGFQLASLGSPNIDGVAGATSAAGDIMVAVGNGATAPSWTLSRYNGSTGGLVTTWGKTTPGRTTIAVPNAPATSEPRAVVPAPDGSVYIIGDASGSPRTVLITRLLPNGVPDTTYGTSGWVTITVAGNDVRSGGAVLDSAGNLVITGSEGAGGGSVTTLMVARVLHTGALDTSFSGGIVSVPVLSTAAGTGVVVTPARIVAAGTAVSAGGQSFAATVALTSGGALDTSYNGTGIRTDAIGSTGANTSASGIVVGYGGRLVIGGTTDGGVAGTDKFATARYETASTLTSIQVTPAAPSVAAGLTQQLTATGSYSDGTTQNITGNVVWSSSASAVAAVTSPGGLVSGLAAGTSTVSATLGAVSSGVTVTVTPPVLTRIFIQPSNASVGVGDTQQFNAIGVYSDGSEVDITTQAAWATAAVSTATVGSSSGVVTGVAIGATTVSATFGGVTGTQGFSVSPALESISVSPVSPSVGRGATQQFVATATFSDNSTEDLTDQATWTSSVTSVATITSLAAQSSGDVTGGVATGRGLGQTTITAVVSGISGTATLTVVAPPPAVTAVAPSSGTTGGSTSVTLTGSGFTGATIVTFGSAVASSFTVVSDTSLTVTSPVNTVGVVAVQVTGPTGTSAATTGSEFTYKLPPALPVVSGVSPTSGPSTGGTVVTVSGTGFTGATSVIFGNTAASSFTVLSDTSLTATSPHQAAGTINVHVVTPGGKSHTNGVDLFTYSAPPAVTGVSPASGPAAGGTVVTVAGTGFTGATSVLFGNVAGTSLSVASDTSLTVTSPAEAAGSINVHVITPNGKSVSVPADLFTYPSLSVVTGVSPVSGPKGGGTVVTVLGTGFTGATSVLFGNVAGTGLSVASDTSLTVTSPAETAATINVHVITPSGRSTVVSGDLFTFQPPPAVTGVSPAAGPHAGGTVVTVSGTGFTGATSVLFGNTAGTSLTVVSDTTITVTSPGHSTGPYNIHVITPNGKSTTINADLFTYQ